MMEMPGGLLLLLILQIFTGITSVICVTTARSGPSSQSVQFRCGNTVCPTGMDCISNNASVARCADPCERYTELHHDWRSTNNTMTQNSRCDKQVNWQGWYRLFLYQTSARIPERCVPVNRCGTHAPLWITEPHPTQSGVIVNRNVCVHWGGSCCLLSSYTINVKICNGNYYVYKLVKPKGCYLAYCAEVPRAVPLTTPGPESQTVTSATLTSSTPGTTADVQRSPLQPQLICGRDRIQIGLNVAAITSMGLNPLSGNLAVRNCSGVRMHNGVVWYEVDAQAGACGNTLRTNRTHAIYSNSLFLYRGNVSFSRPVSRPFSCAYPLDTDASMNVAIRPVLPPAGGLSGLGSKARASMSLFRTSNFTQPYPSGLITLPVGSPLHVGVSVSVRDSSFVAVLENCYASNSSNPNETAQYFFIQNKCPTDRQQVAVIESGSSQQARFSALFFLIHGEYSDIYLHCSLSLCDQRSSRCVPSCRRRVSRSVSSSAHLKPLTIGPINWYKSPE